MAIGRTSRRRKSSAVLRRLAFSSSRSSPATAMPQQRLRLNVPRHATDRNLILDTLVFILASSFQISLWPLPMKFLGGAGWGLGLGTIGCFDRPADCQSA